MGGFEMVGGRGRVRLMKLSTRLKGAAFDELIGFSIREERRMSFVYTSRRNGILSCGLSSCHKIYVISTIQSITKGLLPYGRREMVLTMDVRRGVQHWGVLGDPY